MRLPVTSARLTLKLPPATTRGSGEPWPRKLKQDRPPPDTEPERVSSLTFRLTVQGGFPRYPDPIGKPWNPKRLPVACEIFHGGPRMPGSQREDPYEGLRTAGLLLSIPTLLIVSPLVGFFIGSWLDRRLKTSPWLVIIG